MTSIGALSVVAIILVLAVLPWMVVGAVLISRGVRLYELRREPVPRPLTAAARGAVSLRGVVETHHARLVDCEEVQDGAAVSLVARTPFGLRLPSGELIAVEPPANWERRARYSMVAPGEVALIDGILVDEARGGSGGVYREPAVTSRVLVAPPSGRIRIVPRRPPPYTPFAPAVYVRVGALAILISGLVFALLLGSYCVRLSFGHASRAVVHSRRIHSTATDRGHHDHRYYLDLTPAEGARQEITVADDEYSALADGATVPVIVVPGAPAFTQLGRSPHPDPDLDRVVMTIVVTWVLTMILIGNHKELLARPDAPYHVV
jgi:hypothetical protein